MKFKNLKIRSKLLIGFAGVIIVLTIIGFIGYRGLTTVGNQLEEVTTNQLPSIDALQEINGCHTELKNLERSLLIENYPTKDFRNSQLMEMDQEWRKIDKAWKTYLSLEQSTEEKIAWDIFESSWNDWKKNYQEMVIMFKEREKIISDLNSKKDSRLAIEITKLNEAILLKSSQTRPLFGAAEKDLGKIIQINRDIANNLKI